MRNLLEKCVIKAISLNEVNQRFLMATHDVRQSQKELKNIFEGTYVALKMYSSYVGGYLIFLYYLFIYPVSPHCRKLQIYPKPIFPNICWLALTNSTLHRPLPGENQPEFRSRGWISFMEKMYFFLFKEYILHYAFLRKFCVGNFSQGTHYLHLFWLI